jgi:hypothetical protein
MSGTIKAVVALVLALLLAGSHYFAYSAGRNAQQVGQGRVESTRKDAVVTAVLNGVEANAHEQKENEAKARKVSDGFQKEVAGVLDYRPPVASVRLPALAFSGCGDAAAEVKAAGASGPDGTAAGTVVFPEEVQRAVDRFTEGVGRLEKEADKTAAVARGHQQFARENGFYGDAEVSK